ncbi:MAG: IS110 family transposase [Gammaproteobacteria bacterium]|nr:IS110 family transposase [Rhodothermaceae bacterium]MXW45374.1 IS110 family transposase [Gammaproteobacteria bacterium]MXZ18955.1 IS110 family transposase [Rhodothermaceae bacterium]MYC04424.1 IS110 family transposase [Rhodothermaceae bacterium]MYG69690.1 IS110 family transposase [Rhodothermaceae bacterium]
METYNNSLTSTCSIFTGMDVHKKTVALCIYSSITGVILDEREFPHDVPKILKYLQKAQDRHGKLRSCYEASSCGFGLHRALEAQGMFGEVIAPSSIPSRSGDRVKTDRRDARNLAMLYAAGLLPSVTVPDENLEAVRSLVRCRTSLVDTRTRIKQQILAFLQLRGFQYPGKTSWTKTFLAWLDGLSFTEIDQSTMQTYLHQLSYLNQEVGRLENELAQVSEQDRYRMPPRVLMAFRGMGLVTSLTVVSEFGDIHRLPIHAK